MKTAAVLAGMLSLVTIAFTNVNAADPSARDFQRVVDAAHVRYRDMKDGRNADYIPILTKTPDELFGMVIARRDGRLCSAGDVDYKFTIRSMSGPFTSALVMSQQGPKVLQEKIGAGG